MYREEREDVLFSLFFGFGDDLLSHGLSRSTIGAWDLIVRVREGIGSLSPAMITKPEEQRRSLFLSSLWDDARSAPRLARFVDLACARPPRELSGEVKLDKRDCLSMHPEALCGEATWREPTLSGHGVCCTPEACKKNKSNYAVI